MSMKEGGSQNAQKFDHLVYGQPLIIDINFLILFFRNDRFKTEKKDDSNIKVANSDGDDESISSDFRNNRTLSLSSLKRDHS